MSSRALWQKEQSTDESASHTLASEVICRLLEATRDFDFNGGDYISLGMVSWTLSVRPGPPLLWVLELGAGQGL